MRPGLDTSSRFREARKLMFGLPIPTDRKILKEIYKRYYPSFAAAPSHPAGEIYVAVDLKAIAKTGYRESL